MKFKIILSYFIILVINASFILKYLARVTSLALPITLLYIFVLILVLEKTAVTNVSSKFAFIFFFLVILLISVATHFFINIETLNVDRWSVIDSFYKKLMKGEYPYFAKSNMGNPPGPMPTYFALAFPFYLTGLYSLLSALGYLFFSRWLQNRCCYNKLIILLLVSPFLYWEIVTRSNIFTYSFIILYAIVLYQKNAKKSLLYPFALGLILATRSIFILAYIILFINILRDNKLNLKEYLQQGFVAIAGFILPFMPLVIAFPNNFKKMNPFIVQSTFLIPKYYIIIFILIAIFLAFYVKNKRDVIFYSGISLFVSILVYVVYHIINVGFYEAFFNSVADISYFIFSVPFLLYYIHTDLSTNKSIITE